MKWAPHATRSHLEEYLSSHENALQGIRQHSGLSLAIESIIRCAGSNAASSPLGVITLDRWPACVKNNSSCSVASIYTRSHYMGEVAGMLSVRIGMDGSPHKAQEKLVVSLLAQLKASCHARDVLAHQECVSRISALLIVSPGWDRQLVHAVAWAPVEFFSEETIESVVACWRWILSARSDLEFQMTEEMISAWNATIDRQLGIFAPDPPQANPLSPYEGTQFIPSPPYIGAHELWIKV